MNQTKAKTSQKTKEGTDEISYNLMSLTIEFKVQNNRV